MIIIQKKYDNSKKIVKTIKNNLQQFKDSWIWTQNSSFTDLDSLIEFSRSASVSKIKAETPTIESEIA